MPKINIRHAVPADAETVARHVHALLDELSGGGAPSYKGVLGVTREVLASDRVTALLADLDDEPVGVMVLNECVAIYAGGVFGEISELYIAPEARSKGIVRKLLEHALSDGQARGWKRVEVGAPTQPDWARTLAFYVANWFEEVGPRLRRLI